MVLQMDSATESVEAASFQAPNGREVVRCVDMRAFVNGLMFNCTAHPGMAEVFMQLLSFDGHSFRAKFVKEFGLVGKTLGSCMLLFQDAVVIGVVDTALPALDPAKPLANHGLVCDPSRVLTATDRLIFIGQNSSPKLQDPSLLPPARSVQEVKGPERTPFDILVCGWRPQWNEGTILAKLIRGLARELPGGSLLLFLNLLSKETFHARMDEAGFARSGEGWSIHPIFMGHTQGDASDLDILRKVLGKGAREEASRKTGRAPVVAVTGNMFESAIVMGTMASAQLPSASRDLRVLSTMLLLRQAQDELHPGLHMHVVGENVLDATAELAIAPRASRLPDFVNTVAIYARGLATALAFPVMQPAVAQLFHQVPGGPELCVMPVGDQYLPLGPCSFAHASRVVAQETPGAVLIGYLTREGKTMFALDPASVYTFRKGDQIVFMRRRAATLAVSEESESESSEDEERFRPSHATPAEDDSHTTSLYKKRSPHLCV